MSYIEWAIYDPPNEKLPPIAVVFGPDGEILASRSVPNVASGEELINRVANELANQKGLKVRRL